MSFHSYHSRSTAAFPFLCLPLVSLLFLSFCASPSWTFQTVCTQLLLIDTSLFSTCAPFLVLTT